MTQKQCETVAAYRYTWPGRNESYICEEHSQKLCAVANAMGLYLQLIPIDNAKTELGEQCAQKVSSL